MRLKLRCPRAALLASLATLALVAGACSSGNSKDSDAVKNTDIPVGEVGTLPEAEDEASAAYGGKIAVGVEAETNNLTPGVGQFGAPATMIAHAIFDPLIVIDPDGKQAPFLAEALEPNDELTEWTLTLRPNVTFHDGTPLDAEALKWNWDTLNFAENARNHGVLINAMATGMEIVDDLTVKYVLSSPNAGFPDLLRNDIGWPVSPTACETDPEGFGSHPVGTGPFKFSSWKRDDRLTVQRNENYWLSSPEGDQLPYLDEIEFRVLPDDATRVAALKADDIQVIQTLRAVSVTGTLDLVDEGGFLASRSISNESVVTVLNVMAPPLDDLRIRRAMAYSYDSAAVAEAVGGTSFVPLAFGLFSEDSPWYSAAGVADYPSVNGLDLDAGKELVEDYRNDPDRSDGKAAGDAIEIEHICLPDPSAVLESQIKQARLEEIGLKISLVQLDQAPLIAKVIGSADSNPPFVGDFQSTCFRASGGEGDPTTTLQGQFGPVESSPVNFTNFTDERIDEALVALREGQDFETRYDAVETINKVVSEQVPYLYGSHTATLVGYRDDVRGIADWRFPDGSKGTGTPGAIARFHVAYLAK